MKIPAIILAAGAGRRMGRNKALVMLEERTFLQHVVQALCQSAVISDIITVIGAGAADVATHAADIGVRVVHNPDFEAGLLSSIQCGLMALPSKCDVALLSLVDVPLFAPATVRKLADAAIRCFPERRRILARPVFRGRPGHPCLIGADYFAILRKRPASDRGGAFLFQGDYETCHFVTDDCGTVTDFDCPDSLEICWYGRGVSGTA